MEKNIWFKSVIILSSSKVHVWECKQFLPLSDIQRHCFPAWKLNRQASLGRICCVLGTSWTPESENLSQFKHGRHCQTPLSVSFVIYTRRFSVGNVKNSHSPVSTSAMNVCLSESSKVSTLLLLLLMSLFLCLLFPPRETGSLSRLKNALVEHVFFSPKELLKLSVPSVVYGVQNNMAFLALSNLDAAVYQVWISRPNPAAQLRWCITALSLMKCREMV